MRKKKQFVEYSQAKKMVNDFELSVETKLDYQISYKEIHADLPSDPISKKKKTIIFEPYLGIQFES